MYNVYMRKNNLSLCMITKNEQDTIAKAIASVSDVVSQIIVADTGSTDGTTDIARSYGAKVVDFKWCDDFSAARNFSIKHATSDWIMFMDADEVINPADTLKIPPLCGENNLAGYIFIQRNYTNDHKRQNFVHCDNQYKDYEKSTGFVPIDRIALFRNIPEIYFNGIIHETVSDSIVDIKGVVGQTDIVVHHYGHIQPKRADKIDYYLTLGQKQINKTPCMPKPYYDVGIILMNNGDYIEAEKYLQKTVELDKNYQDIFFTMAVLYMKWLKFDEALKYLGLADKENQMPMQSLFTRGVVYNCMQKFDKATKVFKLGTQTYPQNPSFRENLGILYLKTSQTKEANRIFTQLAGQYPDNKSYVLGKIQSEYFLGNLKTAQKSIELWDKNGIFNQNIAVWGLKIIAELNMFDQLKNRLDLIENLNIVSGEICFYKGLYYQNIGNASTAIVQYKQAIKLAPYLADQIQEKIKSII